MMKFVNTLLKNGSRARSASHRTRGQICGKKHFGQLALAGIAAVTLAAATLPAHSARIDARSLACGQAFNLVRQQGAIVLTLTNTTYDRIVAARHMCPSHETGRSVYTQTLDAPKCFIGYRCVSGQRLFKGFGN